MREIGDQARRGEGRGLLQDAIDRFGKLVGPKGEVLFSYDTNCVNRFLWKVVRGLYALELNTVLPQEPPSGIRLVPPRNAAQELREIHWFPFVRDTEPLASYGRVFDYKWLSWKDDRLRGHAFALLFWDGLLATMLFHDPTCECGLCEDWKLGRPAKADDATGTNAGDNRAIASADAKPQSA